VNRAAAAPALQPQRLRNLARRIAAADALGRPSDFLSKKICIDSCVGVTEVCELSLREEKQARPGRGVAARQVVTGRGDLDEGLEEELRVARGFQPELLPLLVRVEVPSRTELLETPEEVRVRGRIGGRAQPRAPDERFSLRRNSSTAM
jgi:hypothetical protein